MKTKAEYTEEIVNISVKIFKTWPAFSTYLEDLSISEANTKINQSDLQKMKEYFQNLDDLVSGYLRSQSPSKEGLDPKSENAEGYPLYPPSEDIYNNAQKEGNITPEYMTRNQASTPNGITSLERNFEEGMLGDGLDVPGSELDDQQENIGSEDEENNYYSLGGDNHED